MKTPATNRLRLFKAAETSERINAEYQVILPAVSFRRITHMRSLVGIPLILTSSAQYLNKSL